uniref:RNA helicase n=1 Tax=Sus scrofa TaxID=9823 RepID=A0A8D1QMU0_PIG
MPEEADCPPAKRFRPGAGPPSRARPCPPGRRVVMLLNAGGGGGGRRQQPALAHPSTSPYPEAVEQQRRSLPIFQARGQLLAQLRNLDSAILIGETGSGKTTQIPQYLYEGGIGRQAVIAVTQPRRVAAISLATRVSDEKRTELGKLVGYTVRFDDVTSDNTKIKFLTDGMLLREAISDSLLRKYSCVILDEAHERTIHTDVLFGVVKAAQRRRKELGKLPLKVGAAGCAAEAGKPRGGRDAGLGARGGRARLPSRYPRPCSVPHAGDCDVGHHGRGPVLSVFQWSPRPLPGGPAAPDPDFLHQAASAGLPARRPGLGLPDPPGGPMLPGHPGVPHRAGGDRSHEQDLPGHRQAPP